MGVQAAFHGSLGSHVGMIALYFPRSTSKEHRVAFFFEHFDMSIAQIPLVVRQVRVGGARAN